MLILYRETKNKGQNRLLGSDLRWLAGVAELADFKEAMLSLWDADGWLVAGYQGNNSAGTRRAPGIADLKVRVIAQQFQQLTRSFDGAAEVTTVLDGQRLVLRSGGQMLRLAAETTRPGIVDLKMPEAVARTDVQTLKDEVTLAADFVSENNPVFKCLKLVNMPDSLGIMACDTGTGGLLATSIPLPNGNGMASVVPDVLVYATDVVQGLKLVDSGELSIGVLMNRFVMGTALAVYQCSQMDGKWSDVGARFMAYKDYKPKVTLSGAALDIAADNAKHLGSNGIRIKATQQGVQLSVIETQSGTYDIVASRDPGDFEVSYSLKHFQRAALLGESVDLAVPNDPMQPARLHSGRRTYWLASMAR